MSPMTVSRVVNGGNNVQSETRQKVDAAIRETGYRPNLAARSLAGGRQCRIALLFANPSSSYLSEFMLGCLSEVGTVDAQLIVERCSGDEPPEQIVETLKKHRIDGVILPPPLSDNDVLVKALFAQCMPMALVATGFSHDFANTIVIDNEVAAYRLTERLVALGHRRVGFIRGNVNQSASSLREAGYRRALHDAGLAVDEAVIGQGDFTYRSGFDAASSLLDQPNRPTAIFASNDDMASAAIAAAHRVGLDVPRDISICGFDDTAAATSVWPELTTIRQPVADMARRACQLLVKAVMATGGEPVSAQHENLPFEIVVRDSDGKPAAI